MVVACLWTQFDSEDPPVGHVPRAVLLCLTDSYAYVCPLSAAGDAPSSGSTSALSVAPASEAGASHPSLGLEGDEELSYDALLGRIYKLLYANNPELTDRCVPVTCFMFYSRPLTCDRSCCRFGHPYLNFLMPSPSFPTVVRTPTNCASCTPSNTNSHAPYNFNSRAPSSFFAAATCSTRKKLKPPQVMRVGTTRTAWVNFKEICTMMKRSTEHVQVCRCCSVGSSCRCVTNNVFLSRACVCGGGGGCAHS